MKRSIVIVAGFLAAGKTTYSLKLSHELAVPCLNKDLLKISLNNVFPSNNRAESRRLSIAAVDVMLHITRQLMEIGSPIIVEANFRQEDAEHLGALISEYSYTPLTLMFIGDMRTLHKRFLERERSPERGQANRMFGILNQFQLFERAMSPLRKFSVGGEVITIDTTYFDAVDFDLLTDVVRMRCID